MPLTALETARTINGVSFDGTGNITTLTAGTGVSVSGTAVSIGQAVATNSNVTFNQIHTDYANNAGQFVRNIYQSTSAPWVQTVKLVTYGFYTHNRVTG